VISRSGEVEFTNCYTLTFTFTLLTLRTRLLKENVDVLAAFLVELYNWSLQTGSVSTSFKPVYITPLLKKANLDSADPKSYRPIANLSVLSKLLERLVARQLVSYLNAVRLLPDLQSA